MPRENRKRGKRHKKQAEEAEGPRPLQGIVEEPSWIISSSNAVNVDVRDPEAPFGEVEADVKAYFRTVDLQIREWQENQDETAEEYDVQPNEKKRLFFMAALNEMHGKEKQLASDPECSIILERLLYSMDDFVLRVFVDSLVGSYGVLIRHRFASHVCQTLFAIAIDTINRESKGVMPDLSISPEQGELHTLTKLVSDICEEIIPDVASLVTHPFASHVIRSLLFLLSPSLATSDDNQNTVRSRKSATWKARQGQMKSVFDNGKKRKGKEKETTSKSPIPEFEAMAHRIIETIRNELDDNEVRAMAADKVACPMLKLLLEVEADQDNSNELGSLMDRVTAGAVTACLNKSPDDIKDSDYLGTLLRDPNASHILETVVSRCPADVFDVIWKTHFEGKLARLAVHPVANFVVAKAFERFSESQLSRALEELDGVCKKLIQMARTGVMRAAIERVSVLNASGLQKISEIVLSAFGFQKPGADADKNQLVHCILTVQTLSDYKTTIKDFLADEPQPSRKRGRNTPNPLEPKIQGSLLLQSLLKLPESLNRFVIASILDISVEERIRIAHNAFGSRVFDSFLDSATIPPNEKRQLVLDFIGHYHHLVDDKAGSRVADRCWEFSDTYLREKIARSLISNGQDLAASFYGKFFAKGLNLYLLQHRPEEWRNLQSGRRQQEKSSPTLSEDTVKATTVGVLDDRKRKSRPGDDIDALFSEKLGKRKKVSLAVIPSLSSPAMSRGKLQRDLGNEDRELEQVLGAIRLAPKGNSSPKWNKDKKPMCLNR